MRGPCPAKVLLAATLITTGAAAQAAHPIGGCPATGGHIGHELDLITTAGPTSLFECGDGGKCSEAMVEPGGFFVVYRRSGGWACGDHQGLRGGGPGWIHLAALRAMAADPAPPLQAWAGTWQYGDGSIVIKAVTPTGQLDVEGTAPRWKTHIGGFGASARQRATACTWRMGLAQSSYS